MSNGKIPMSQVRTISGIPDDLWEDARKKYPTISEGIKNLLEKDLRTEDEEDTEHIDLLKNSDLTDKQIKAAKDLMTKGEVDKNGRQMGNILRNHFADKSYRDKARKDIIRDPNVPFEKDGDGIKSVVTNCEDCGANTQLKGLRNLDFRCPKCEKRLYDISD